MKGEKPKSEGKRQLSKEGCDKGRRKKEAWGGAVLITKGVVVTTQK